MIFPLLSLSFLKFLRMIRKRIFLYYQTQTESCYKKQLMIWFTGVNYGNCILTVLCVRFFTLVRIKNNPCFNYTIEDNNIIKDLEVTVLEKDLGVNIDPLLTFENHITITVKKVRSLSGLIIRSFTFKTKDIMIPIYKSKVRFV